MEGRHPDLKGSLKVPANATSLVIFAHGSGSSRFSVRNNFVADIFNKEKIATLLTDLLTEREDRTFENRFDIDMLSERLLAVTTYAASLPELQNIPIGYFGATTGAACALRAAVTLSKEKKQRDALKPKVTGKQKVEPQTLQETEVLETIKPQVDVIIKAVVSRGGRPDLAKADLQLVDIPTLLIIGSLDEYVIQLNKQAYTQLKSKKKMQIVDGASHLFEEPGKLQEVASLASAWFKQYLI
jgi:dienelactone hydrolase